MLICIIQEFKKQSNINIVIKQIYNENYVSLPLSNFASDFFDLKFFILVF